MQKPTSEPDYTINLEAIKAIIEAAGNGPFIHHLTHRPGGITHAIFDADGYKCADRLSEHFTAAVITALNFGPEIIDMLIEIEELILCWVDAEDSPYIKRLHLDKLAKLAERIKAGREAQNG